MFVFFAVILVTATWLQNLICLRVWLVFTAIALISDVKSVIFDVVVGSFDFGLAAAVASTVVNSVTLVSVQAYSKNLKVVAKDRYRQNSTCVVLSSAQNFWTPAASVTVTSPILNFGRSGADSQSQTSQPLNATTDDNSVQLEETVV